MMCAGRRCGNEVGRAQDCHPIIYEIYGKGLSNSIIVGWSDGLDFEPKFDGKIEEDAAEAIIRRILSEESGGPERTEGGE